MTREEMARMSASELRAAAVQAGYSSITRLGKAQMIEAIVRQQEREREQG